ncbi:3-oxoacyl-ACP synthase III family protein [Herbiconiux daphne]|uniref:Ketoacyl-ACP synthase III n=1 Tax=Herbiconiux daphne TaxID=2970914 RepID=A0ABT2H2H1_9MICO|nr:3-oxoacyl-[acyl-carrier-protein] synthase III C-terminal domain-containing protein [Herbiconiux daphne]MCS5734148.1 ketoacyl-ACP synthase III [Herbiconiux daphne]
MTTPRALGHDPVGSQRPVRALAPVSVSAPSPASSTVPAPAPLRSRIAAVATYLPDTTRSADETEELLSRLNPELRLPTGLVRRLTGVERVHLRPDGWQTSDLAVAAARTALERSPGPIDLLLFASASQDMIEPATSHIVSAKLGLDCPVMDVKNACNSVLNALQVGDALIMSGQYRRVLIASGEQPSHAVRWQLADQAQFLRSFAGYTMSDAGAALILERTDDTTPDATTNRSRTDDSGPDAATRAPAPTVPLARPRVTGAAHDPASPEPESKPEPHPAPPAAGILGSRFVAHSTHWNVGTLPTGGSVNPHAEGGSYFDMDGAALQQAFSEVGVGLVEQTVADLGYAVPDLDFVAVHQVALRYHETIVRVLGVDPGRTVVTIADHGNLASVSLPRQLELALERGIVGPGSLIAMVGLAGGISLGAMVVRL